VNINHYNKLIPLLRVVSFLRLMAANAASVVIFSSDNLNGAIQLLVNITMDSHIARNLSASRGRYIWRRG
jgi:hypothetical protein